MAIKAQRQTATFIIIHWEVYFYLAPQAHLNQVYTSIKIER
jgi:hypothetical protein